MLQKQPVALAFLLSQAACGSPLTSQESTTPGASIAQPYPLKVGKPTLEDSKAESYGLYIQNISNENVRWYLIESPPWLRFASTNGELGAGEKANLLVIIDRSTLNAMHPRPTEEKHYCKHTATLKFSAGDSGTYITETTMTVTHYAPLFVFTFSTNTEEPIDWVEFDGVRSPSIVTRRENPAECASRTLHDPPHLATGSDIEDPYDPKKPATLEYWSVVRRPGVYTWFYSQGGKVYGPNVANMTGGGLCLGYVFPK